jgi:hypothetical protein
VSIWFIEMIIKSLIFDNFIPEKIQVSGSGAVPNRSQASGSGKKIKQIFQFYNDTVV